jgi:hypothetical protein
MSEGEKLKLGGAKMRERWTDIFDASVTSHDSDLGELSTLRGHFNIKDRYRIVIPQADTPEPVDHHVNTFNGSLLPFYSQCSGPKYLGYVTANRQYHELQLSLVILLTCNE